MKTNAIILSPIIIHNKSCSNSNIGVLDGLFIIASIIVVLIIGFITWNQ